jgi:excisionase family DNA binding protein
VSLQQRFEKKPPAPVFIGTGNRGLEMKEAAEYIGAKEWFVRRLVRRGGIPYMVFGRTYVIDKLDLDRFMEKSKLGVAA